MRAFALSLVIMTAANRIRHKVSVRWMELFATLIGDGMLRHWKLEAQRVII